MNVTDSLLDGILRDMGVDVDKRKPPHWIQKYYQSQSIFGGKVANGYMCSRCGKKSWSKKKVCDGCNSVMEELKGGEGK